MDYNNLPEELKDFIHGLKYGSHTIECDVRDALARAENLDEFKMLVLSHMNELISEAKVVIEVTKNVN